MKLNSETFEDTLTRFKSAWPVSRVQAMTVAEYADLSNHDSLCYWLEYETKNIGAIGGVSLNKFELWKPKDEVAFKDNRFNSDGIYAWNAKRGDSLQSAFQEVKDNILRIINFSQTQNWEEIENVPFHQIGKWKIAFLYSNKTLLPVYSKRALCSISAGLGRIFPEEAKVSDIQSFILSQRPANVNLEVFAHDVYKMFARKPSYYIVGSKYSDKNGNDTIPKIGDFIRNNCVAIGFLGDLDFGYLMGASKDEVNKFVDENWEKEKPAWHKMRRYFNLLSQIKAGDIIAVKSHGSHNQLTIIAYARVVERNGSVYEHNEHELGHHIHVDFFETGLYKNFGLTYAETIHKLTAIKDKQKFYTIFGWYASIANKVESDAIGEEDNDEAGSTDDGDYNEKTEGSVPRGAIAETFAELVHNRIQNRFIKYLKQTYPNDRPTGEKRKIDAMRENSTTVFIYEIKISPSVYSCVRQAIGQLMDYAHQYTTIKTKHIVVVGPGKPDEQDISFINSVRTNLKLPFSYLAFDEKNLTVEGF